MSDPDSNHIRHCLSECEFVILQEIFPSETSQYADILLPGVSFAEKNGTFTNTERRIQMVRKAIEPIGEAKDDWWITANLARRLLSAGSRQPKSAPHSGWNYHASEDILQEISQLTPSYAGVNYARLNKGERLQWPVKDEQHPGTPILHIGQFARGRGKFMPIEHIPPAELPDEEYPVLLSTGRVLYHWHGGEMTRRSHGLMEVYGKALVEINPFDAANLGINGNNQMRVTSRRGSIVAEAWVTDRVPVGMVYANFHFPESSANELTIAALDPIAKIPEYKVCAVKIELA
jgi:formate dehydrogenase major subunit/formate dehydrogenase alpha subunit